MINLKTSVAKVDSARHKSNDTRDIELSRDKKSDLNSTMLNFTMFFTSY